MHEGRSTNQPSESQVHRRLADLKNEEELLASTNEGKPRMRGKKCRKAISSKKTELSIDVGDEGSDMPIACKVDESGTHNGPDLPLVLKGAVTRQPSEDTSSDTPGEIR